MADLAQLLTKNVNGNTFISIDTETEPKLSGGQSNPFLGRIKKVTNKAVVMVFQNKSSNGYENMVHTRLAKEGKNPLSFVLSPRPWGVRVPNTCFVKHKGNYYVEVIFLNPGETHYTLDGVVTPLNPAWGVIKSSDPDQGGLDDKVNIRTFKVANIKRITVNKKSYSHPTFNPLLMTPIV